MAALAGLSAWAPRDGLAGKPDEPVPAPRTFIHEREFAESPELAAQPHQVVIRRPLMSDVLTAQAEMLENFRRPTIRTSL